MSGWVLDTDSISLFQQNHPALVQRIRNTNPDQLSTTVITIEEQLRGRLHMVRRSPSDTALISAYAALRKTVAFFNSVTVLDFTPAAQAVYADLLRQKIRIGTQDLRIAAIALAAQSTLVTRNQRDFSQVPSLPIVDWTLA